MAITDVFAGKRTLADREALARAIVSLWNVVSTSFREDERSVEGAQFLQRHAGLSAELAALTAGQLPDLGLQRRLAVALVPVVDERTRDLHARIDDLDATIRTRDRDLQIQQLAGSWMTDEMGRSRAMLMQALQGREAVIPANGPDGTGPLLSQLLALVLNIAAPPPPPVASQGRRSETGQQEVIKPTTREAEPVGERAIIAQVLREVLDGTAQAPRLARALEDQQLARRLADLFHEHQSYKAILKRLGILPNA